MFADGDLAPLLEVSSQIAVDEVLFAARIHGVSGILAQLACPAPSSELAEGLRLDLDRQGRRAGRLREEAARLAVRAAAAGLPFVPLKGTYLFAARYEDPSQRPMADLDLLAPRGTFGPWTRLLLEEGYELATRGRKDWVFARPGVRTPTDFAEHEDNPRPVELHFALPVRLLGRDVDLSSLYVSRLRSVPFLDSRAEVPDDDVLALHLLVHAGPSLVGRGLRLIQFVDFRKLDLSAAAPDLFRGALGPEVAWGLVRLLERSLPGTLPAALAAALVAPSSSRRKAWERRPGLLLGREERTALVFAELPLCDSPLAKLSRIRDALPEGSFLERAYGNRGRLGTWIRYYRDRLAR